MNFVPNLNSISFTTFLMDILGYLTPIKTKKKLKPTESSGRLQKKKKIHNALWEIKFMVN